MKLSFVPDPFVSTLEEEQAFEIVTWAKKMGVTVEDACHSIALEYDLSECAMELLLSDVRVMEALLSLQSKGQAIRCEAGWAGATSGPVN
jgi:hypothetical protein